MVLSIISSIIAVADVFIFTIFALVANVVEELDSSDGTVRKYNMHMKTSDVFFTRVIAWCLGKAWVVMLCKLSTGHRTLCNGSDIVIVYTQNIAIVCTQTLLPAT